MQHRPDALSGGVPAHRIGQRLPVTYIHLVVDGSIDEKILAALENKEDMAKTVVDSWREVLTAPEKRRNP